MRVGSNAMRQSEGGDIEEDDELVKMRNHWLISILAVLVWIVIAIMNVALLVLVGLGKA